MALGLSFGAKKSTSTVDATKAETEKTNQTGVTSNAQNQTTTGSQNTSGTSTSAGSSTTTQAGTNTSTGASTQQQTGLSQSFSDQTLGALDSAVQKLLNVGGSNPQADAMVAAGMKTLGAFDPEAYVANGMAAFKARQQTNTDEATGGIVDAVGGQNNSAVALLKNRMNVDNESALGGILQQLTQGAQGIVQSGIQTAQGVANSGSELLSNLLSALKGGVTATTGTAATQTAEQAANTQTGTTNTAESNATTSNTQTKQVEDLASLLTQLLSGETNTNSTSNTKTKGLDLSVGGTVGK